MKGKVQTKVGMELQIYWYNLNMSSSSNLDWELNQITHFIDVDGVQSNHSSSKTPHIAKSTVKGQK